MLSSVQQRVETILQTIDRLEIVKINHLLEIHDLKSYRNACRVISTQLRPFINETYFQREKVISLNKSGRDLIASENDEVKISLQTIHYLLRNEVYIYYKCPADWKNEYPHETSIKTQNSFAMFNSGFTPINKKKVVSDAIFTRNGYMYLIEVDNEQDMKVNKKKIDSYREIMPSIKDQSPILCFFTTTQNRKRKLEDWLKGIRHEVLTFEEIR